MKEAQGEPLSENERDSGGRRGSYSREQRGELASGAAGKQLRCPACGGALVRRPVEAPGTVSYVRRRVWFLCPACRRSAAVDVKPDERV